MSKPKFDPSKPFEEVKPKFDPSKPFEVSEEPGIGSKILEGIGTVGKFLDQYGGGAAARSAVGAALEGENPITAFGKQYGEEPGLAPSGKELAMKVGIPESVKVPSSELLGLQPEEMMDLPAAGVAGFAADVALDPLNLLPVGAAGKLAGKAGSAAMKATKGVGEKALEVAGKVASKAAEAATGVSAKDIRVYADNLKEVNAIIDKHGQNFVGAADDVKAMFNKNIQDFRRDMNQRISDTLKQSSPDLKVNIKPVVDRLYDATEGLTPAFATDKAQLDQLDSLISQISDFSKGTDELNAGEMFKLKEQLQDMAKPAYFKDGQIFSQGKDVQKAAKLAAREARLLLNKMSPEIAEANNQLAKLHAIDDKINKTMLKEGKSYTEITSAGKEKGRARKTLEELETLTGKPFIEEAEKLSAAQAFANPSLTPLSNGTTSTTRTGIASTIGFMTSGVEGAVVANALSSPLALKTAINAGVIGKNAIYNVLGGPVKLTDSAINQAYKILQSDTGQRVLQESLRGARLYSIQGDKTAEFPLESDVEKQYYIKDLMDDDSVSVIEKAKLRTRANKKNVGSFPVDHSAKEGTLIKQLEPKKQAAPIMDLEAAAKLLQKQGGF